MFTEEHVAQYKVDLCARPATAIRVPHAFVENPDWQPEPRACHNNADMFCRYSPDHVPVRGWLIFDDIPSEPGIIKFAAHSVIRTPEGDLADITPLYRPLTAPQPYPFLEAYLSDDDFREMLKHTEDYNLVHDTRGMIWPNQPMHGTACRRP